MATLTTTQRTQLWRGLMRFLSANPDITWPDGVSKLDLYDPVTDSGAIVDTDAWIEDHQGNVGDTTGYNGALQNPFKSNASAEIKTVLFCGVAAMRQSAQFARRLFGEVD